MRISGIDFPNSLVSAMRDDKLVVFAGAGVSMGMPANLPDFRGLTESIAQDTGIEMRTTEPEDRFLGRLMDRGVNVHDLAARRLSMDDQQPNTLHCDLLRLFPGAKSPRVVTTNFDLLFEQAAKQAFDSKPEVFRAPALPLGSEFTGIVHVHGTVDLPGDMVLTDKDFGRAYLTDGWARRFLVDLFRSFSVLFVGYSHNDTVMNYLARALPLDETEHRFALTTEDDTNLWQFLGIKPVTYPNPDGNHKALCQGVSGLADNVRRGNLAWQQQITAIASGIPSFLDEEEVDLIDDALSDPTRTRFFTGAASAPEWVDWLDGRRHLSNLFGTGELHAHELELISWLASKFAVDHSEELFRLIGRHSMHLHAELWYRLGTTIGLQKDPPVGADILARWVSLLLDTAPEAIHRNRASTAFYWLGERCIEHGLTTSLIHIFGTLSSSRLKLSRWNQPFEPVLLGDDYELKDLWDNGLKPNLNILAEPLLTLAVGGLKRQHLTLSTWEEGNPQIDMSSWHRSAIELHEQDSHPESIDVLIDAARDCLENLTAMQPAKAIYWCDLLVEAETPLLRRLAVHTLPLRDDLSDDEKIVWLLTKIGLHDAAAHHETYKTARTIYPDVSQERRQDVIDAVLSYCRPWEEEDKERRSAYQHFSWLNWLHDAAPECDITKEALEVWPGTPILPKPSFS